MTYSVGYRIPDNSILRQGTLIVGVTKRDPIAPAVQSLEEEFQKAISDRNGGTKKAQKSEPTTRKSKENT